ncbi:hypothetical protein BGZ91_011809 [Linnemannia elongata]|nr:hypothetical protein BGZ91_011809 [Linnemannia elongata]
MVSLVLLILAPVLILAAVVVAGIALFAPGPTKPKPKVTPTLTTPLVPTSNVIFTTRILPEKGKVTTTPLLPSNIVTTKPFNPIVNKIPPSSLSSAIVITTTKVPEVATTTSKIPEVVTTKSVTPPPPPPIAVPTTTSVAKVIPIPVPVPAPAPVPEVPSDENIKEKNKDDKNDKDRKDDEDEEEDDDDWEEDDDEEEEEEEDESPNINGTTGIQAVDPSDSRHVATINYESGSDKRKSSINKKRAFRMRRSVALKQGGSVLDAQVKPINESNKDKKPAVVEELQKQIDEIVKEKSAPFEAELVRIMTDLLDSQGAVEYQDVLSNIEITTQQEASDSSVSDNKDAVTQTTFHAQDDATPAPAPGFNPRALLNTLLQPFIIQFRTDVRNTVIFICGGQHDGLIDGAINAALALECLKTHFGHLTTALGKLLVDRFAAAKEFLLKQVAGLAGIPRFLLPFSEEGDDKGVAAFAAAVAVAAGEASVSSEEKKERIERSGAFAEWLVDSMVHEFQLAVEQDQELANGGRSNTATVTKLPDAEEKKKGEEEEETSPPLVAREPSQPRIRSRRSTNKI